MKNFSLEKIGIWCLFAYLMAGYLVLPLELRFLLKVALFSGIVVWIRQKSKFHFHTKHCLYLGIYFCCLFISIFFNEVHFSYEQNIAYIRTQFIIPLGGALAIMLLIKNKALLEKLFWVLSVSFLLNNLYALCQFFQGELRVSGLAGHTMGLAGVLILLVPTMFILVNKNKGNNKWFLFVLLSSIPVIGFNGTRTVWLVMAVIFCLLAWQLRNPKIISLLVACILAVGSLLYYHPYYKERFLSITDMQYQSNSERLLLWQSAYQMFKDHPIVGVGVGNFTTTYQREYILPTAKERTLGHAHNIYLQTLAESGMIGFMGFGLFFGYTLLTSFLHWRKTASKEALILFAATCGLLLQGLTEVNIGNHTVITRIYWMIFAIYLVSSGAVVCTSKGVKDRQKIETINYGEKNKI